MPNFQYSITNEYLIFKGASKQLKTKPFLQSIYPRLGGGKTPPLKIGNWILNITIDLLKLLILHMEIATNALSCPESNIFATANGAFVNIFAANFLGFLHNLLTLSTEEKYIRCIY